MKKSLLALAVLGAFAGAAQAQSSVTLYGIVDAGVLYTTGNQSAAAGAVAGQTGNRIGFQSGIEATNRWGIRGSEDLGGGLAATFALENGFSSATGGMLGNGAAGTGPVAGKLFDRGATVGLKGGFGSVTLGRNWSPFVLSQIAVDSNGFSNFGSLNSLAFQATSANPVAQGFSYYWVDNSIVYNTPSFSGFDASLLYGFGNVAGDNGAGRTWSLSGKYANGPLTVAAGYFDSKNNGALVNGAAVPTTESGQRAWHIGGKYNFGVATAHVEFANYKNPFQSDLFNTDFWSIGAAAPIGTNMVFLANWIHKKDKNVSDRNADLFKFAVDYNFSKTTTAYVNLGFTRNKRLGNTGLLNSGYTVAGENQTALGVGLRKAF